MERGARDTPGRDGEVHQSHLARGALAVGATAPSPLVSLAGHRQEPPACLLEI
jgi:hypothetical protein